MFVKLWEWGSRPGCYRFGMYSKAQTVATAAVTWIVIAAAILQETVAHVANSGIDGDTTELFVSWAGRAIALLLGIVAIVRRVTPVPESERGLA